MKRLVALVMLCGPAWLVAQSGCGPACHPSERVTSLGVRHSTGVERVYQTSPPEGPFLPFEGATHLRIRHGLGVAPHSIQIRLAFSERPLQSGGGGSSFAAGNQALILRQDADEVSIKNDSCANYFIHVMLEGHVVSDAGSETTD